MWLLTTAADEPASLVYKQDKDLEPVVIDEWKRAPGKVQYAILSHRWEDDDEEVTFDEMKSGDYRKDKIGCFKLEKAREQARQDGYQYVWIDTCCIDKRSSAELQEAINSMYHWYGRAAVCYAYLNDVDSDVENTFDESRWFTRGWTLQELLAPEFLQFLDKRWIHLGTKKEMSRRISIMTGIPDEVLQGSKSPHVCSVAQRMFWASKRETSRIEDIAYSLLGIFDVNLPLIYGERGKAFRRLQEEIIKSTADQSIFAWDGPKVQTEDDVVTMPGFLASSPRDFNHPDCVIKFLASLRGSSPPDDIHDCFSCTHGSRRTVPFSLTNTGVNLTVSIRIWNRDTYLATLNHMLVPGKDATFTVGIFLAKTGPDTFERVQVGSMRLYHEFVQDTPKDIRAITIVNDQQDLSQWACGFRLSGDLFRQDVTGDKAFVFDVHEWEHAEHEFWDSDRSVVRIEPGHNITPRLFFSQPDGVKTLVSLGYDKDFNPTVLFVVGGLGPKGGEAEAMVSRFGSSWNRLRVIQSGSIVHVGDNNDDGLYWHEPQPMRNQQTVLQRNKKHPNIWFFKAASSCQSKGIEFYLHDDETTYETSQMVYVRLIVPFIPDKAYTCLWDLQMHRLPCPHKPLAKPFISAPLPIRRAMKRIYNLKD